MAVASATPPFSPPYLSSPRHRRPDAISLRPFSISAPNCLLQLPLSLNSLHIFRRPRFAAEASIGDRESGGSTSVSDDEGLVGEDAAVFDLSEQKLTSWVYFTVILGVVLFVLNVVWIDNSAGGVGKAFLDAVSGISDSHEVVMLLLTLIFAIVHSGLASLRDQGEKLVGERAFRVLFAGVSLPLAVSTVVYFINHRYDGVQLWQLQSVPGLHQLVWLSSFVSFFFLYPSTFNLLEVAAVDKPKMHLWETGIIRITRHPQMVGQVIWCLAHTIWIGNSVAVAASIGLIGHHLFGVWNGDRRLAKRYGVDFEAVKRRTSIIPFAAIVDGRQKLPDDYYKEFLRLPYLSITALTIGAYLAHPLMQVASFRLHWRVMDCQSSHTFDSDESDIDIQTEIYEKGGSIDDIRNDLDFCLRDDDKVAEQSVVDFPMDGVEPYIGMEFSSRDEAREFYVNYGRRVGFTVRIHHNRRSRVNNQVIGQDFVCSKEGFRAKKYVCRKDRILPAPPITREGCQAMMRLALRDGGKWAVTKFVKDHNHLLLSPSKVPWKGSGKNLSEDEKDKRIRDLSLELYNERQKYKRKCAAYEEQLKTILKELEMHTECISNKVAEVVKSIREVEEEEESKGLNERWI